MKRKLLAGLAILVIAAFVLLLIVGYENAFALLRYRFALFLLIFPLIALFLWSVYKTFERPSDPKDRSNDKPRLR